MGETISHSDKMWLTAASIFYTITGLVCLAVLAMDYRLIHIALIGIFSLASAFCLYKRKRFALWCILPLFFTSTSFSASMLYYTVGGYIFLSVVMAVYLILTWIFTFYSVAKRALLKG